MQASGVSGIGGGSGRGTSSGSRRHGVALQGVPTRANARGMGGLLTGIHAGVGETIGNSIRPWFRVAEPGRRERVRRRFRAAHNGPNVYAYLLVPGRGPRSGPVLGGNVGQLPSNLFQALVRSKLSLHPGYPEAFFFVRQVWRSRETRDRSAAG